ncbi:MAG: DUF378 domain-containing protein [bacterium]|nr:DUF378 domain-containing protein [bacterium]
MNKLLKVALVLIIVGAINWGLVGMFDFDLVAFLFKEGSLLTRIIYIVIMAAGVLCFAILPKDLD